MHAAGEPHHVADKGGKEGEGRCLEGGKCDTEQSEDGECAGREKTRQGDEIRPVRAAHQCGIGQPEQRPKAAFGELYGRELSLQVPG